MIIRWLYEMTWQVKIICSWKVLIIWNMKWAAFVSSQTGDCDHLDHQLQTRHFFLAPETDWSISTIHYLKFGQQDNSSRRLNASGNVFTHLAISALWLATFLSSSCFLDNHRFKWFASFEERYIYIRLHQNIILSKLYSCINTHKYILLQIWSVIWSKLYLLQVNHV